jgi:hypothetical protein
MHRPGRNAAELFCDMSLFGHDAQLTVRCVKSRRVAQTARRGAFKMRLIRDSRQVIGRNGPLAVNPFRPERGPPAGATDAGGDARSSCGSREAFGNCHK